MRRVGALIAAVVAVQIFLASRYYGFLTGDDVEVLEEAFHRAVGLAYQPWNVRNLFVPDFLVAPFVLLGGHDTAKAIRLATIPFVALTALTIWLVHRLAAQWSGDEIAASAAAALFALHWIPLGFGSTVYPRTLATACIVAAALLIERSPFVAGLLVGVAFADRFSEIVFLIPLLVLARRRAWIVVFGTLLSITITVGVYDWITWGVPFGSVINFAKVTLVEPDFASRVKYQSPLWYLFNIARWCAPTLLPLLYMARRAPKGMRWMFIVVPLAGLSLVRHKELRYLQAMIPFLMIAAGAGFAVLYRSRRAIAVALLVISLIWNAHGLRYFARKSMPAVMAARALTADPRVKTVVVSQLWAYGDRLYFGRVAAGDVGTPPRDLHSALQGADAAALYETDFDHPELLPALRRNGFGSWQTFRDGPARAVVVFTRSASGTSDRVRR